MSSTQELREKAERCRRLATTIDDLKVQKGLIELAESYEAEAALTPPEPDDSSSGS